VPRKVVVRACVCLNVTASTLLLEWVWRSPTLARSQSGKGLEDGGITTQGRTQGRTPRTRLGARVSGAELEELSRAARTL